MSTGKLKIYAGKVIAIDGPAGSGKSTIARNIAARLGFEYLDTGAMYRAVAWVMREEKLNPDKTDDIEYMRNNWEVTFRYDGAKTVVFYGKRDISEEIRDEEITAASSAVALRPKIREFMVALQQQRIARGSVVLEGRDTGTIVAPRAHVKIFLVADPRTRAERRFLEYMQKGIATSVDEQLEKMAERDRQDSERSVGPLTRAVDAITVDTTELNIEEAVEAVLKVCKTRMSPAAAPGRPR